MVCETDIIGMMFKKFDQLYKQHCYSGFKTIYVKAQYTFTYERLDDDDLNGGEKLHLQIVPLCLLRPSVFSEVKPN